MKKSRKQIKSFSIAGYKYYEGPLVFNKLKLGKKITLVAETNNKFYFRNQLQGIVVKIRHAIEYILSI